VTSLYPIHYSEDGGGEPGQAEEDDADENEGDNQVKTTFITVVLYLKPDGGGEPGQAEEDDADQNEEHDPVAAAGLEVSEQHAPPAILEINLALKKIKTSNMFFVLNEEKMHSYR
jgi:hypothetical protein